MGTGSGLGRDASPTRFEVPANYVDLVGRGVLPPAGGVSLPDGVRTGTFHGLSAWLVETPWSTAAVSMFGGQVLSFVPRGQHDVFWLSPRLAGLPTPIRGGVPVVWPYFGRQDQADDMPAHGFARTLGWSLDMASHEPDGTVALRLSFPILDGLPLRLHTELRIGSGFEQRLVTENNGDATVVYSEALHAYFRVGDVSRARVEGLDGVDYLDKHHDFARFRQQGDWQLDDVRDPGRSDRIYRRADGHYLLVDVAGGRRIELALEGSGALVVWNPGTEAAAVMTDVGADAWRGFVCLEAANAGDWRVALRPGECHALVQRISVLPGGG
ncbi:MAG: D-hexose-6-phosphate mutarotase [Luteimonas sp.]|nr:D-hexose-6-phosphate mutarotase [Luteimonas sp.]